MQGVKGAKERTENLTIRLTPEEKRTLIKFAALAGMSVTSFIVGETIGDKIGQMVLDGFNKERQ